MCEENSIPALIARFGGHMRGKQHACLPLLPVLVVTGEENCMPACPCCPLWWPQQRKHACLAALTSCSGGCSEG